MDPTDFEDAYQATFTPEFTGFTPAIAEIPNGDGKVDAQKRYAHINLRTLPSVKGPRCHRFLEDLFYDCLGDAQSHARHFMLPIEPWVSAEDSTLRLLEYPPGVGGAEHTDFDLFTINVFRSHKDLLVPGQMNVHFGELIEIVTGGHLKATPHYVKPHPTQTQRSAVFFVMPKLDAVLPNGVVVRDWLAERKARSRVRM